MPWGSIFTRYSLRMAFLVMNKLVPASVRSLSIHWMKHSSIVPTSCRLWFNFSLGILGAYGANAPNAVPTTTGPEAMVTILAFLAFPMSSTLMWSPTYLPMMVTPDFDDSATFPLFLHSAAQLEQSHPPDRAIHSFLSATLSPQVLLSGKPLVFLGQRWMFEPPYLGKSHSWSANNHSRHHQIGPSSSLAS